MPEVIIKYPTPENAGKIIYRDRADVCYKYSAKEVPCPSDKSKIKKLDIQHNQIKENPVFAFINKKVNGLLSH